MAKELRFLIIDPAQKRCYPVQTKDLSDALALADLKPQTVDHGVVERGLGIVVYENSLFEPVEQQHYFELNGKLYAGNAVLYGYDKAGNTVDAPYSAAPVYFQDHIDVENAIVAGIVERPVMAVNGVVFWKWPDPT